VGSAMSGLSVAAPFILSRRVTGPARGHPASSTVRPRTVRRRVRDGRGHGRARRAVPPARSARCDTTGTRRPSQRSGRRCGSATPAANRGGPA
jgi:hypothetical protein